MEKKAYTCANLGASCDFALSEKVIEIEDGAELLCPGCGRPTLEPVKSIKPPWPPLWLKLLLAAAAVLAVVGFGAWIFWPAPNPDQMLGEFFPRLK